MAPDRSAPSPDLDVVRVRDVTLSADDLPTTRREKLARVNPETLGQAARIPGVTPAAIAVLDVYLSMSSART